MPKKTSSKKYMSNIELCLILIKTSKRFGWKKRLIKYLKTLEYLCNRMEENIDGKL